VILRRGLREANWVGFTQKALGLHMANRDCPNTKAPAFPPGPQNRAVRKSTVLLDLFAGFLIDNFHRQANLAAIIKAQQFVGFYKLSFRFAVEFESTGANLLRLESHFEVREPLNNTPFGISQKCQPPTAPWRGLLQRFNLLKRLMYLW
jgi:hypothetical protein